MIKSIIKTVTAMVQLSLIINILRSFEETKYQTNWMAQFLADQNAPNIRC